MKIFRAEPLHQHHFHDVHLGLIDRLLVKRERERPDFNRRMFDEDFARLFRSMNQRSGNLFDIVSNDEELTQKLLGNIKTRYAPHSVDETIRELVEEIAQSLIWSGRAYFFLHDDTEQEKIHMASFSSDGVVRLFCTYIQWVPKRLERHWDRDDEEIPREIRILDAAKVMRFDMPTPIKRMLSAQNRTLAVLDKHQFGEANFHSQATHENPNPTNHFDFRVWRDTQERALYRATRRTGWNGRKYDSTKRSDFFDCHRLIRFRRNQLLLRDDILNQLSSELSRIGKGYKAEFSVEISGTDELPNVSHLNELEVRLASEEVGFNEIIDYCYKR
ncbi:hypothetical protein [uncultured Marinobacter sp.]|uniref:hypothetical protein n=1 Tax=uncultured Marinobacter sp. TaxID=187379 RepID=UPI00262247BC|nr:hypothetical protein [uncultured Marinobacter sp.]